MASLSIQNFTQPLPTGLRSSLATLAERRLKGWELSLVFVGPARAKSLNKSLRGKTYTPNVLSYEVGARSGEIIICPSVATKEAPEYDHTYGEHLLYLFIHGILHLEGRRHGATMEQWEQKLLASVAGTSRHKHGATHHDRHRHRDLPGQSSRRRGDGR